MSFLRPTPKATVFFIVDGPRIEAQAIVLATTLRYYNDPSLELVAYSTPSYVTEIRRVTRRILRHLDVAIEVIDPDYAPGVWSEPYPIGNKILAASQPRSGDVDFFLDSDIAATAPMSFEELAGQGDISAVVSDYAAALNSDASWEAQYALFGVSAPKDRVRFHRGRRLESYPYFNAGVIGWHTSDRDNFTRCWLETARRIDQQYSRDPEFPRNNIDQFALPIAARRLDMRLRVLSPENNYNIMHRDADEDIAPRLVHYHRFKFLWLSRFRAETLDICSKTLPPTLLSRYFNVFADWLDFHKMPVDSVAV